MINQFIRNHKPQVLNHRGVMKKEILYFDEPGPQNTEKVLEAVKERLKVKDIRYVVVASESGATALKAAKILKAKIICVVPYGGHQRRLVGDIQQLLEHGARS